MSFSVVRTVALVAISTLLLTQTAAVIIELNAGQTFCLADLEKDHPGPDFEIKFFGASYSDGDMVNVSVT